MSSHEELKPCPFCSGTDLIVADPKENPGHESWVYCTRCSASSGMASSQTGAIDKWNSRDTSKEDSLRGDLREANLIWTGWRDRSKASDKVIERARDKIRLAYRWLYRENKKSEGDELNSMAIVLTQHLEEGSIG